jgi:hypothetical protein
MLGLKSKQNDFKATYYERAYNNGVAKKEAATQAQAKAELATKTLESKIGVVSQNMEETTAEQSKFSNEILKIKTQVANGERSPQDANSHLEYYQHM